MFPVPYYEMRVLYSTLYGIPTAVIIRSLVGNCRENRIIRLWTKQYRMIMAIMNNAITALIQQQWIDISISLCFWNQWVDFYYSSCSSFPYTLRQLLWTANHITQWCMSSDELPRPESGEWILPRPPTSRSKRSCYWRYPFATSDSPSTASWSA